METKVDLVVDTLQSVYQLYLHGVIDARVMNEWVSYLWSLL